MIEKRTSLIDNWSLEYAGSLLNGEKDHHSFSSEMFSNSLGGLSNYINSLLLYDETIYLENGFEKDWERFRWFQKNTDLYVKGVDPTMLQIDWTSPESYSDKGIKNYVDSAKSLGSDLFVSPERAGKIIEEPGLLLKDAFQNTLDHIDEQVKERFESSWFDSVKERFDRNFLFPSLTHYVLSEASNTDDLFTVIVQIKGSGKVGTIREKINEIVSDTKAAFRFQKEVEMIIQKAFGATIKSDSPWSLEIPVIGLNLTRSVTFDFFRRKQHLLFLKDIVASRSESGKLEKDVKRIFNRSL